jgi:hypothetical protein
MKLLFLLVLCIPSLFAGPREEAEALLQKLSQVSDKSQRLDLFSRNFLGLPYGTKGPLGEGALAKYDQDPLYRFDLFDCTTYVETIMALSLSRDVVDFEKNMDEIRYVNGEVGFLTRNHFTDLQWIPNNVRNGYLREINTEIAPVSEIKTARAMINFTGWIQSLKVENLVIPHATHEEKEKLLTELREEAKDIPSEEASVDYLPISYLVKNPSLLTRVPHGAIVNFVRPNWDLTDVAGTHQNISHQGFLFWKGKTLMLRHASSSGEKKVLEVSFLTYLKSFLNHPTLKGVHFMDMNY